MLIKRRMLPVLPGSRLAKERLWFLARFVMNDGARPPVETIPLVALREKVAEMMVTVDNADEAHWQKGGAHRRLGRHPLACCLTERGARRDAGASMAAARPTSRRKQMGMGSLGSSVSRDPAVEDRAG